MGIKGDKMMNDSVLSAELIVKNLEAIEGITSKKMFGGHGIFHEGKMFGMVDSKGGVFFKADADTQDNYLSRGAQKHSKMPYFSIPEEVLNNIDELVNWANQSISISK